jgi:hypothetical protein
MMAYATNGAQGIEQRPAARLSAAAPARQRRRSRKL